MSRLFIIKQNSFKSRDLTKWIKWISEAWVDLDADKITSSFQRCGIT